MTIDLKEYLKDQNLEETIQVLDEILLFLVTYTEENGVNDKLSHQYITIRNLRNTLIDHSLRN